MRHDSLIRFRWAVEEGGYRFVTARDPKGASRRWMVEARSPSRGRCVRRTFPLEEKPALFREFGDLEVSDRRSSEESIRGFANEHGALTRERLPVGRPGRREGPYPGEDLRLWREEIRRMRGVIELLDATVLGDQPALKRWVRLESGRLRYRTPWIRGSLPVSTEDSKHLRPGDAAQVARFVVERIINSRLPERTGAALLYHPDTTTHGVHLVPVDLLGALWLQCALALGREQDYRQCWQCGTWMEIVPAKARSDRVYCSTRCRQKAYRQRKERTARRRRR
jgi:hypothetical protein